MVPAIRGTFLKGRRMLKPQVLRPYQAEGVAHIFDAWKRGARSVLAVAPTGSGKTSLFTWIVTNIGAPALIVVHRRELADQAANRLREFGAPFGYIMAGEPARPSAKIQVGSVQTLVRRKCPRASLVIFDEAHLSTATTWATIRAQYPNAKILGVTATPWRLGGKPLVGAYDACVVISTPAELREQGYLCPYVGFSYLAPDLSGVRTTGGDYNEAQTSALMSGTAIVDNIVERWGQHARDLSTVVFAVTVSHSKQLAVRFVAAGVKAEHLDGSTHLETRRAILRRVERGETRVLCNVGVAVEGLDIPRLKCCVLARPTMSLARAIQMMGRVRRPWEGQTARIHDHAFVISRHGLPDAERDYSLTTQDERPPGLTTCDECLALFSGRTCPNCAHENAVAEQAEREIVTVASAEEFTFDSGASVVPEERNPDPVAISWSNSLGRAFEGFLRSVRVEPSEYGEQKIYRVEGAKRDYDLPGTTRLDYLLKQVALNSKIRVVHTANTELAAGRRRREFSVAVDDGADGEGETVAQAAQRLNISPETYVKALRDGSVARLLKLGIQVVSA